MPRSARFVLPGYPHHVVQRGNRRQQTFFEPDDYAFYIDLLGKACCDFRVKCWAWCLMPNHVHLVLEPSQAQDLALALKRTHQVYARHINARMGWAGCLWQGRFGASVMDEGHALAAVRYIELNPVRARLVGRAEDWAWSSARGHVWGDADPLVSDIPFLRRIPDWRTYLSEGVDPEIEARIGYFTETGHPMGEEDWVGALEVKSGRVLRPRPRGRPASKVPDGEI
ncbi:transposase [Maricaulis alexandrii]|uniref:transposase n=1 Tax=Maricaulis alexandrii TaxID=2570354 RepID=UPI00110992CA|nr:transposase [Maricaulis alexandrii]